MSETDIIKAATYTGDGVYLHDDGYHVTLLTWDGMSITNRVHLDADTLSVFVKELRRRGKIQ